MKYLQLQEYLIETSNNTFRIGYGIRNEKTHELIKFFGNLHLYTELKKWKEENPDMLDNGFKLTNELETDGKRTFYFWSSKDVLDVPKNEKDPRDGLKNFSVF